MVVLAAPHHQPSLRVCVWDRLQVPVLVPVARFRGVHETEIWIQISALAGV